MSKFVTRDTVLDEINQIPENKLPEVYEIVHHFRENLVKPQKNGKQILKFAGCWTDMPDDVYNNFLGEITSRRKQAFSKRKSDETRSC